MSWTRTIELMCDGCDECAPWTGRTLEEARRFNAVDGWTYVKGRDLCPECSASEHRDDA